jgi:hypothetical protein
MPEDQPDTLLPLGNAAVVLQADGEERRFTVDTATLTPRGQHSVRLTFQRPHKSVAIELPRVVFWRLTTVFHQRSAAADFGGAKPGRRRRGKRS